MENEPQVKPFLEDCKLEIEKKRKAAEQIIKDAQEEMKGHGNDPLPDMVDQGRRATTETSLSSTIARQKKVISNCDDAILRISNRVFGKCFASNYQHDIPHDELRCNVFATSCVKCSKK
jgi:RNA polymerase-binding transcription factor DksA